MTVFLFPNPDKDPALAVSCRAAAFLQRSGASVLLRKGVGGIDGIPAVIPSTGIARSDAVLSIGGDGTLLQAAKLCVQYDKPILGINVGRTGFLATCEVDEIESKLPLLLAGQYQLDRRSLLAGRAGDWECLAMNDIVLYNGRRQQAMDFSVFCDGALVNTSRSDGVITATPTGSTAYSLSAGGPVLDAHIAGFVVNAICSHSMKDPPIVFSADRNIVIRPQYGRGALPQVSCDGEALHTLQEGEELHICLAQKPVSLISFSPAEQFEAIDKKLKGR